jgi:hypothetical protein
MDVHLIYPRDVLGCRSCIVFFGGDFTVTDLICISAYTLGAHQFRPNGYVTVLLYQAISRAFVPLKCYNLLEEYVIQVQYDAMLTLAA